MPRKRKVQSEAERAAATPVSIEREKQLAKGKELLTIQVPRAWCEYVKTALCNQEYQTILTIQQETAKPNSKAIPFLYKEARKAKRAVDILRAEMRRAEQVLENDTSSGAQ